MGSSLPYGPATIAAAAIALALAGCPRSAPIEACNTDKDCARRDACIDGLCVDAPDNRLLAEEDAGRAEPADAADFDGGGDDSGPPADAGAIDAGDVDAGEVDAGEADGGDVDAGAVDAGALDAGALDAGALDAGALDAGAVDAGALDAGAVDAGVLDAGPHDGGTVAADGGLAPCLDDADCVDVSTLCVATSCAPNPRTVIAITASVAECINPVAPDPDECETLTGAGEMNVDLMDSDVAAPRRSFVRFDVGQALAGQTVAAVRLRLVSTSSVKSNGPSSGEIWAVEPFSRDDLFVAEPAQAANMALATDRGAIGHDDPVEWVLPTSIVADTASVFLGVRPLVSDGVNYWNTDGARPPLLLIELE